MRTEEVRVIQIDARSSRPLYEQIYEDLRRQILAGTLPAGMRLPATRTLAADYHVARNTVTAAYAQLVSEGYARSIVGSGYYVEHIPQMEGAAAVVRQEPAAAKKPASHHEPRYSFQYGSLDLNVYRTKEFRRCLRDAFAQLEGHANLSYANPQGEVALREALAKMLAASRGVNATAGQVYVTGGVQHALRQVTDLLPRERYAFAIEEPGYSGARDVFARMGYRVIPVPLDANGIDVEQLAGVSHAIVYVTPSHQFPMGQVLPAARRIQLLRWAEATDSFIIEDDYDSELRYRERPIPSLQSMDGSDRVIYLGTFSKSLSPDLRVSYMVLPRRLHVDFGDYYSYFGSSVPTYEQLALAAYLESGAYSRRINYVKTAMGKRHDLILQTLASDLPNKVQVHGTGGGVHFVLELDTELSQEQILASILQDEIGVMPMGVFWSDGSKCPHNQVLIGYGAIGLQQLPEYLDALVGSLRRWM